VTIPKTLQAVLWSKATSKLDIEADKNYIIHQVLSCGTWEHLKWLFKLYGYNEVKKTFINHPSKSYTPKSFNLFKNIILEVEPQNLDEKKYVKTFPRIVG